MSTEGTLHQWPIVQLIAVIVLAIRTNETFRPPKFQQKLLTVFLRLELIMKFKRVAGNVHGSAP
jgi:type II secretory pathway component PulF